MYLPKIGYLRVITLNVLRIMKYPGAKGALIPEIRRVFLLSNKDKLIDVFGGSGIVSLNIPSPVPVYNDVARELTGLFEIIKQNPSFIEIALANLADLLEAGEMFEKETASRMVLARIAKTRNAKNTAEQENAASTLFRLTFSFGGMGSTYATNAEKSIGRYVEKTLIDYPEIMSNVRRWQIENLDFRDLFEKYNDESSFFYFDPPYLEKNWYNNDFTQQDFQDLKSMLRKIKGDYLLSFNADSRKLIEIFGKPTYTKAFRNESGRSRDTPRPFRVIAFYTNAMSNLHAKNKRVNRSETKYKD